MALKNRGYRQAICMRIVIVRPERPQKTTSIRSIPLASPACSQSAAKGPPCRWIVFVSWKEKGAGVPAPFRVALTAQLAATVSGRLKT